MAYSHLSPQACLEKHVKNDELCGSCQQWRWATSVMADATDTDPDTILDLARSGDLSRHANPLVHSESLPDNPVVIDDEKGLHVNTRIVYVNGRRLPQGIITEMRVSGTLGERSMVAFFLLSFFTDAKLTAKNIAVDEYYSGRLQTRYEWNAGDEKQFGEPIATKAKHGSKEVDVLGFRMFPVTTDNFSRG